VFISAISGDWRTSLISVNWSITSPRLAAGCQRRRLRKSSQALA
jgi:hypothetical protein